jgi:hypothetical protein
MAKKPPKKAVSAAKRASAKKPYKGKYPGPDKFKGDKKKVAAWRNKKAAAAAGKKPAPKPAPKPAAPKPAAAAAPKPLAPPAPVGMPDGSIVDPAQWQADQARLMAAENDNAEYDSIIAEEQDANLTEQSEVATAEQRRAAARLAASQKLKEFKPMKVENKKNLDNALSYRGMGRSTAYKRKNMDLVNQHNAIETGIASEQTKAEQDYTSNVGAAAQRKAARLARVTPRKNLLAQRGARAGVYTK